MDSLTNVIKKIVPYFNGTWDALSICTLIFRLLLLMSCCFFVVSVLYYLKKYRIFKAIWVKFTGNAREYDRIRRTQMRAELEERSNSFSKKEKSSFITKLYTVISKTGIIEKVPGFSEFGFLISVCIATVILFGFMTYKKGLTVGIVSAVGFTLVVWYTLSLIAYNRKINLEKQLLQFTNACASASLQYSNIIDIFGAIYEQFSAPLKEGLEACYVEAKQTNNKELAIEHLKERYDSVQFSFVIDNLELCSSMTGDYYSVSQDITEPLSIYNTSHEKKRVLLRNAKINITAMFVIAFGILYALSMFLGNLTETLFNTTIGNISLIGLILLYFYGLNMKAEK